MRIIVAGYIVGYPLGGMSWHHLNYLAGFADLGHEVWFYEDSGQWSQPYNPVEGTVSDDPRYGIAYLRSALESLGLSDRFCYFSELENRWYGRTRSEWLEIVAGADLVLCVSGVTPWREEFAHAQRTCVIDTDPVYTQLRMLQDKDFVAYYRAFDRVATFGRLIGRSTCELPTAGFDWIATNQPVSLKCWPAVASTSNVFSTLGKWDLGVGRQFEFGGRVFQSNKGMQWLSLRSLPERTDFRMEMAMAGVPDDIRHEFESHGWHFTDPTGSSISPDAYRQFIQSHAGELTVAKQIYTGLPSGWFSDRSACYLASGKPVVTQRTGFEQWLPTGNGLFAFDGLDDAAGALQDIAGDYPRHSRAARAIAEEYFDARTVLRTLLDDVA